LPQSSSVAVVVAAKGRVLKKGAVEHWGAGTIQ